MPPDCVAADENLGRAPGGEATFALGIARSNARKLRGWATHSEFAPCEQKVGQIDMLHMTLPGSRRTPHFIGGASSIAARRLGARPFWPRILCAALVAVAGSDARGQTSKPAPVVELQPGPGFFVESDDLPLSPPTHPPIDTIPSRAMPVQGDREPLLGSSGLGAAVSFDLSTRRETRTPNDSEIVDRPRSRQSDSGRSPGRGRRQRNRRPQKTPSGFRT